MKIKITENQHSKIKLIVEQEEYMLRYEKLCKQKGEELNRIYSKIINLSIDDILNMQLNVEQTINIVKKIESEVDNAETNMIKFWDSKLIGDDDENFDLKINNISLIALDKSASLLNILGPIEELQRIQKSRKITNDFPDVKSVSIQSY